VADIVTRLRQWVDRETIESDPAGAITAAADEIERLREAIRRMADQDATLAVVGGTVTVTMDATLTDAERESLRFCIRGALPETEKLGGVAGELCRMHRDRLRWLLERLG